MTKRLTLALSTLLAVGIGAAAIAQNAPPALGARQGEMRLIALNIGVLGGMARGNIDYDADLAQMAANNLVAISQIDPTLLFPDGTAQGEVEGTLALPTIWEDRAGFLEAWAGFGSAAEGAAGAAGGGLDAMRAAMGPLGGSCSTCHDTYRATP